MQPRSCTQRLNLSPNVLRHAGRWPRESATHSGSLRATLPVRRRRRAQFFPGNGNSIRTQGGGRRVLLASAGDTTGRHHNNPPSSTPATSQHASHRCEVRVGAYWQASMQLALELHIVRRHTRSRHGSRAPTAGRVWAHATGMQPSGLRPTTQWPTSRGRTQAITSGARAPGEGEASPPRL